MYNSSRNKSFHFSLSLMHFCKGIAMESVAATFKFKFIENHAIVIQAFAEDMFVNVENQ